MMNRSKLIRFVIVVGMLIALAGCGPVEDEAAATPSPVVVTKIVTSVPTEDAQATEAANIFSTYLANVTNTAAATTPTAYPTRAVTPTIPPIPTSLDVPLSEEGPWLVFQAWQLYAMNADGSGLKQLTEVTNQHVNRFAINPHPLPDGSYQIAYTTISSGDETAWLHLLRFPNGTSQEITPLLSGTASNTDYFNEAYNVHSLMGGVLRWSPDGSQLAFAGAIWGPTSDVYTYTPSTGEIVQLTDGPTQAWNLLWSPDGRYIVHTGNEWFEGSGSRYSDGQVWAVRADGSGVTEFPGYGAAYVGWLTTDTLILYAPDLLCSAGLRTVNVDSGIVYRLGAGCFDSVAYNLDNNLALVTFSEFPEFVGSSNDSIPPEGPGAYVLRDGELEFLSAGISSVYWSSLRDVFYGGDYSEFKIYEIFPETGEMVELDAPTYSIPRVSPDGQYWAWSRTSNRYAMPLEYPETEPPIGLWIDTPDGERIQVDTGPNETTGAEYVMWASDSTHIFFIDNKIGYIAVAPDFIPQRLPIGTLGHPRDWQFEWVP